MEASSSTARDITRWHHLLVGGGVLCLLWILYGQAFHHDFVYFDDDRYVLNNLVVRSGLSVENVLWAFQSFHISNWHPLTWVSYMFDATVFGMDAGWYVLHNAALHGINSLLVYAILLKLERDWLLALGGAVVFLVHPLHVESVAWIAERKDVLSGMFYLAGIWIYINSRGRSNRFAGISVVVCCTLALLSKPMAVTFPLVLVLYDVFVCRQRIWVSAVSKWPLFLGCLVVGILTLHAQEGGGAMSSLATHSVQDRVTTAVVSYATYLYQFLAPTKLAAFYPLEEHHLSWKLISAALAISAVLLFPWLLRHKYPLLAYGISFWFVTLLPVIGILQVGAQAHADRYMYLPALGLLIALLELPRVIDKKYRRLSFVVFVVWALFLATLCYWQIAHWKNRGTLFSRVLSVSGPEYSAYVQVARHHMERGDFDQTVFYASKAMEIQPKRVIAQVVLGDMAMRMGDIESAEKFYMDAVSKSRETPYLLNKIGLLWVRQGKLEDAVGLFARAVELSPIFFEASENLDKYSQLLNRSRHAES